MAIDITPIDSQFSDIEKSSNTHGNYFVLLGQKYNLDVSEIGGYDWLFGVNNNAEDMNNLVLELEEYCKRQNLELHVERDRHENYPIMVEVKGLENTKDFYEGGKQLNQRKGFWDDKPRALGSEFKHNTEAEAVAAMKAELEKSMEKDNEFGNLTENEKDIIRLYRLQKKYGENLEKAPQIKINTVTA